jgi:crotonobetainyl-CoA:carnitine CoA-transferase CaiB-like acyl-CoA transferase
MQDRQEQVSGPLSDVLVIDLTTVAMGPYATQILGDMGADVIKVESPNGGDIFRYPEPYKNRGMSAAFLNLNRNKRSIALDLKQGNEKQVFIDLVTEADVFVYNVRPQAMRKLGLDYESLRERNPRLIYCGAYGFSEGGPYAGRPAYDDIIQGISGLASLQGKNRSDGPRYVNTIMADKIAGLAVAYAVAMALYERERSGLGQAIEVPMFENLVSFLLTEHMAGETFRPPIGGMGYERVVSPHRKPYRTKDGYMGLMPYTTEQWGRFFTIAGKPELAADPRITDPALRSKHIGELYGILSTLVEQRSTAEWLDLLQDADIPVSPILSPDELLQDPHLRAQDFFRDDLHPSEGEIRTIGIPVKFSRTPGKVRFLAPRLDEHRKEILREMGERKRNGDEQ